jgi:hypothetical protein
MQKYKKKVFTQKRDQESNEVKLRFVEKENEKLKKKLAGLREEYQVEMPDMDETDR